MYEEDDDNNHENNAISNDDNYEGTKTRWKNGEGSAGVILFECLRKGPWWYNIWIKNHEETNKKTCERGIPGKEMSKCQDAMARFIQRFREAERRPS